MQKHYPLHEQRAVLALLRELREESGLRQEDIAAQFRQPQQIISRYESGERRIDILELRHLCQIFAITPAEFFERLEVKISAEQKSE
jgi:transcriptional regulator with XRE-family HTH domain